MQGMHTLKTLLLVIGLLSSSMTHVVVDYPCPCFY